MDRNIALELVRITETAALYRQIGWVAGIKCGGRSCCGRHAYVF